MDDEEGPYHVRKEEITRRKADLTAQMHINCFPLVKHVKQRANSSGLIFIIGPLWWFALY